MRGRGRWVCEAFAGAALCAAPIAAQDTSGRAVGPGMPPFGIGGTPEAPQPTILAQDADWGFLADPTRRKTAADRLRHISLDESAFFSLGINAYAEYEVFENPVFGRPPIADGYVNTRANVYAGLTISPRLRLFGALKHGGRTGDAAATVPAERDDVDLHQGFVELGLGELAGGAPSALLLRIGRQELQYGSGRLLATREGPNVRDDFDAVVVRGRAGGVTAEAFGAFNVSDEAGAFDNGTLTDSGVWGLYTSAAIDGPSNFDLYYFGDRRLGSPYFAGVFNETRHTIGARAWKGGSNAKGFTWDIEATYQFGPAVGLAGRPQDVSAWNASAELFFGWTDAPLAPIARVSMGLTSGDGDPNDRTLGTFRAPRSPGTYFGATQALGPGNLLGVSLGAILTAAKRLEVTPNILAAWRMTTRDGIYAPPGRLIAAASGEARFVGAEINLELRYRLTDELSLSSTISHFFAGDYLKDNPPGLDTTRCHVVLAFVL